MSKFTAAFAAGLAFCVTPALAQPLSVERPDILKGRLEIEQDNTTAQDVLRDNDTYQHSLVAAYSFTDNLRFGAGVIVNDGVNSGPRADAYLAEVRFEGPRPSWMPFEWGLIGTYIGGGPEGVNDSFALRALAAGDVGPVMVVANLEALREIGGGASDNTHYDLLLEGQLPITEHFIAAITYSGQLGSDDKFGNLGSLGQYLGPTLYTSLPVPVANSAIGIEAGVLFGLTNESTDTVGKVNLTWASQF